MNPNYLDFEQPIADLEAKIQELRHASHGPAVNVDAEVHALREKLRQRTAHIFRDLNPWQVSQLARHPARPYTNDYIRVICDEFQELAGDRAYADDAAIVGGLARIDGRSVVVIGHQKGRDTKSKVRRNFGMPRPEGYRKALRLMKLAERFKLVTHREQKEMSYFALVPAKGGPKIQAVKEIPDGFRGTTYGGRINHILRMPDLAYLLSRFEKERPIIDQTGLRGMYEVKLEWTLQQLQNPDAASGPSLFTALSEQLGLKLEARKGPVEILVVDSAEKIPVPN